MIRKTTLVPLFTVGILMVSVASSAFGQNGAGPPAETTPPESVARSAEWYEAQVQAQREEMQQLRARIERLEAMLQALADGGPEGSPTSTVAMRVEGEYAGSGGRNGPLNPLPPGGGDGEVTPRELLPDLGHIGAQVGLLFGGTQNPFRSDEGFIAGGYIDLPLKDAPGGKISYEILASLQRTTTDTEVTSPVIALVNNAIAGDLFSPLPVTNRVEERMTVLTVMPFGIKYTLTSLDRHNFRPYAVVGLGTYVTLTNQKLVDFDAADFVGPGATANLLNTLLNGPLIGGLAPQAPELRERGVAAGQGDFRFGVQYGGGVEYRISPRFSMGFDLRFNKIEGRRGGTFTSFAARPAFHF